MTVDFSLGRSVQLLELPLNVIDTLRLILLAFVLREADGQRTSCYLLCEHVLNITYLLLVFRKGYFFVEEKNKVDVGKPGRVADRVEQFQRLLHSVLQSILKNGIKRTNRAVVLSQSLIVF